MSTDSVAGMGDSPTEGPLASLPRLSRREARLARWVSWGRLADRGRAALSWLTQTPGAAIEIGDPEVLDRGSGMGRPGLTAQLSWPSRSARIGLGIETQLAHALIDHLLGFTRLPGEERLPLTPVERGLMAFVIARSLAETHQDTPRPTLTLDHVGPEPFQPDGPIVTLRWPVRVGAAVGSARLWLPASLTREPPSWDPGPSRSGLDWPGRFAALGSTWRGIAGSVALPRGLGRLRVGGVLPLSGASLRGPAASPLGRLTFELREPEAICRFAAEIPPDSRASRVVVTTTPSREAVPREALLVSQSADSPIAPADVPVTLTVELGRVSIPLHRLADLKPGDVLELNRHAREPVELTSNGRLVARGELIQIDTDLGVRITNVLI